MADDVQVKFGAEISDLQAGINSIKDSFAGLSGFTQGMMESFTGIGEAIGAAFAGDKIIDFAEKMGELGEQVERTSAMTGLSTKAVIDFQYAVKMMGGDGEAAAASLRILERNMGQAQAGSEKAATALKDAGVSMKTIASGNIQDALGEIANHFSETADGVNKTTIAIEAMGRGGSTLIPVLDQGSNGLHLIYVEADRVNSVLEKNVSKFAQTGQAIKTASDATSNYTQALYTALEPALNAIVKTWDAWMTELTQSTQGGNLLTAVITGLADAFEIALVAVDALITGIEQLWDIGEGIIKGLVDALGGAATALQDLVELDWSKAKEDAETYGKKIGDDIAAGFDRANKAGADFMVRTKSAWDTLNGAQVGLPAKKDDTQKPPPKLTPDKEKDDTGDQAGLLEKERTGYTESYENKKEADELKVQSGKMTNEEMFTDLQAELSKEHDAIHQSFLDEEALYAGKPAKQAEINQEMLNADQKYLNQKAALDLQAAKQSEKSWDSAFNTIDKSFDTMLTGVLQGTQTIPQAFERMAGDMIISFTEAIAKMLIRWAALKAATAVNLLSEQQAGSIGGGANNGLMSQLTMGILSLVGIDLVSTAGTDANTTAVAALTAAVTANTTALVVSKAVPSFDVGSPNIPHDMVAQIHQGEMIVPANTAAGVRSGDLSIGGAAGGGVGGDSHTHFHISSMDSAGVAKLLKQHGAAIAAGVAGAARGGNGGLRTALGRM